MAKWRRFHQTCSALPRSSPYSQAKAFHKRPRGLPGLLKKKGGDIVWYSDELLENDFKKNAGSVYHFLIYTDHYRPAYTDTIQFFLTVRFWVRKIVGEFVLAISRVIFESFGGFHTWGSCPSESHSCTAPGSSRSAHSRHSAVPSRCNLWHFLNLRHNETERPPNQPVEKAFVDLSKL